ncbi:hypothetical protein J3R82DRAFT_11898 [Butyriboletus roseoflavus]|nr:hypothetical protein J3R82DRAFT_11898 [Butyriboletus roseoflavus]
MTVGMLAPRDVPTTLNYCASTTTDGQTPYYHADETPEGVPRSNMLSCTHSVVIHDARGREEVGGLDVSGFLFTRYPSVEKDFVSEENIQTVYYAQCEEILRECAGAKRVVIFNHTIRKSPSAQTSSFKALDPAYAVHVDKMKSTEEQFVKDRLGDDAERLMKGRYRVINVWRPIANTVAHDPLAVADYRSVDLERDLLATRLVYPDRDSSTNSFRYNGGHKWYYLSDQTPDEVILIKCFDSDTDKAQFAPHSAFPDKTSPASAPPRQSIEVRALVFDTE